MRYVCKKIVKKEISKNGDKKALMNEIKIHRQLKHMHICKFMHFFDDNDHIYIMLEICHNKSLLELLNARQRLMELEV